MGKRHRALEDVMTGRSFANTVLGGLLGLLVLGAVYSIVRSGTAGITQYALQCLAAALLAGLALRLGESRRVAAAITAVSSLAALWVADTFLARHPLRDTREDARAEAARVAGVSPDPRTMAEAVQDLRRVGGEAWPTVYIGNSWQEFALFRDTLYPLASISGVKSVMCREVSYVVYRSDEHGFTNPSGQWGMAQTELALVGDSHVMGWCVRPQDSFASAIRAGHPATIVLAHGASGPLTQLAQMREFLPPLRPRHVLWFYYEENDLSDLTVEKGQPILIRYLETGFTQRLAERQAEVDQRLRSLAMLSESLSVGRAAVKADEALRGDVLRGAWSVLRLSHLRSRIATMRRPPPPPRPCCEMALLGQVVRAMQATVAGWGGDLSMVYLPSESRLAGRPMWAGILAGDSVIALVQSMGVPVLDLRSALGRFGAAHDLYVYEDSHLSTRGHQAVATLVLDFLARRDSLGRPSGATHRAATH